MKFSATLAASAFALLASTSVSAAPLEPRAVNAALIPQFGFKAGVNPTGTGDCDGAVKGANGKAIKIPCSCPPDRKAFIASLNANVAAGHAVHNPSVKVSFPTGNGAGDKIARIQTALVTLQNLRGPGQGCPAVSTTFLAQQAAVHRRSLITVAKRGVDPALVPPFGHAAGVNPTGTGDCDGAVNGPTGPIKIPCACPPDRNAFIDALNANVAVGHATNNPAIAVEFPTDNSAVAQVARIQASLVTLQNLRGPGQGCPASATTFVAQQKAITG